MSTHKITAADLIFRRPVEMSDTYELHAGNVRVAVVEPTFDCTGDRIVTLYRAGETVDTFRVTDWTVPVPQLVADRLHELEELRSALPGHELSDATTDRARAVGTLRTVACSCSRTQWTADGLQRAVELHDTNRAGAVERAAVRAREEYRNALVLATRYGTDAGRVEAVEELRKLDAVDEILPPSDDVDALDALTLEERITRTVELHGTSRLWDAVPTSTDYRDTHPDEYAARTDYPCHICGVAYGH